MAGLGTALSGVTGTPWHGRDLQRFSQLTRGGGQHQNAEAGKTVTSTGVTLNQGLLTRG